MSTGEPLDITNTDAGLSLSGEIDAHTAPKVAAAIEASPLDHVEVDMAGVEFVDSSGLRVLIEAHQSAEARGGSVTLARPSTAVVRLLEISGVNEYLNVTPS
jgi:anti-sigma B factor antagonist